MEDIYEHSNATVWLPEYSCLRSCFNKFLSFFNGKKPMEDLRDKLNLKFLLNHYTSQNTRWVQRYSPAGSWYWAPLIWNTALAVSSALISLFTFHYSNLFYCKTICDLISCEPSVPLGLCVCVCVYDQRNVPHAWSLQSDAYLSVRAHVDRWAGNVMDMWWAIIRSREILCATPRETKRPPRTLKMDTGWLNGSTS